MQPLSALSAVHFSSHSKKDTNFKIIHRPTPKHPTIAGSFLYNHQTILFQGYYEEGPPDPFRVIFWKCLDKIEENFRPGLTRKNFHTLLQRTESLRVLASIKILSTDAISTESTISHQASDRIRSQFCAWAKTIKMEFDKRRIKIPYIYRQDPPPPTMSSNPVKILPVFHKVAHTTRILPPVERLLAPTKILPLPESSSPRTTQIIDPPIKAS